MISAAEAGRFAVEWIEAWNSHDLDKIMSHYADDVEFTSPFAVTLLGDPEGRIRGKEAVRAYFAKGLEMIPDLHFELLNVMVGVTSLTLFYQGVRGIPACEVVVFNGNGKVILSMAHYTEKALFPA